MLPEDAHDAVLPGRPMRVLIVENYQNTPPGVIGPALAEAGASVDLCRAHEGDALPPDAASHDAIVVLGGAQSALDDETHPYLPALAGLIRGFGDSGKAVLGVCLGAQLVARAYGATNVLGRPLEFGWRPVRATAAGKADRLVAALGDGAPLFHWHTDTFTLPPGAVHLAASDLTAIQAFRIGDAVYGIQFHFEADSEVVTNWTREFAEVIAGFDPGWRERLPAELARNGGAADAAGLAIARAWVELATARAHRQRQGTTLELAKS